MTFIRKIVTLSFTLLVLSLILLSCKQASAISNQPPPEDNSIISLQRSESCLTKAPGSVIKDRFEALLLEKNEKVPDFTLHTADGIPFNLYSEFSKGKPLLLLSGSQTCEFARENLDPVNELVKKYKDDLTIAMVYTIEPHPFDTVSPYSTKDKIWLSKQNRKDSIYIKQQRTYKERKEATELWQEENDIEPLMLVDNPDNYFWLTFGQAPNMAYLIGTDTTIFWRQAFLESDTLEENINLLLANK